MYHQTLMSKVSKQRNLWDTCCLINLAWLILLLHNALWFRIIFFDRQNIRHLQHDRFYAINNDMSHRGWRVESSTISRAKISRHSRKKSWFVQSPFNGKKVAISEGMGWRYSGQFYKNIKYSHLIHKNKFPTAFIFLGPPRCI